MAAIKFGTDGWRGIIAEDFTFANARVVAEAIGRYVVRGEDPRKGVIVGYDHRYALEKLVDWDRIHKAHFRFAFDAMHGSAAGLLPELFLRHGIECHEVRGTRDPRYGGAHPEPIEPHIAPLQDAVRAGKYDAGF